MEARNLYVLRCLPSKSSFILLAFISLWLEVKSSTKIKDEVSPFIYLHVFVFSLILNPLFNALCVHFNSVSWQKLLLIVVYDPLTSNIRCVSIRRYIGWFVLEPISVVTHYMVNTSNGSTSFHNGNRICIGLRNVWTSVTLEHALFLIVLRTYE